MRLLLLCAAGCAAQSSGDRMLERIEYPFRPGHEVERLLVMVGARSFETSAVRNALEERAVEIDVITVESAYANAEELAQHLHDDLMLPERRAGRTRIYVLGFGVGAQAALHLARRYANEPDGVILLRPELGDDPVLARWLEQDARRPIESLASEAEWAALLDRDPFGWIPVK